MAASCKISLQIQSVKFSRLPWSRRVGDMSVGQVRMPQSSLSLLRFSFLKSKCYLDCCKPLISRVQKKLILTNFASYFFAFMKKNFQKSLLPLFTDIFPVTIKKLAGLFYIMWIQSCRSIKYFFKCAPKESCDLVLSAGSA